MILFLVSLLMAFFAPTANIPPEINRDQKHQQYNLTRVLNIDSERQLFVTDYIIASIENKAELRLHHPTPQNIAMIYNKPWEGAGCGYNSIFKDGNIYKMYYKAWHRTVGPTYPNTDDSPLFCCYAESEDGINWNRPQVELFPFHGSSANNIVFTDNMNGIRIRVGEPAVFKDENPNASTDARYKALFPMKASGGKKGLIALKSKDGIHWQAMSNKPVITDGAFDSQNTAFWDSKAKEYRAYWRYFDHGIRSIRTAVSKDFIHWSTPVDLKYLDTLTQEQLYTNCIKPYYRAPQIYIGFPARYIDRGWSKSMGSLPDSVHRVWRSSISPRLGTALTDGLFMASRNGVHFKRYNNAFLRPGIERPGTWSYGQQYIGWSIVETKSPLKGAPNVISLYATEYYWTGAPASKLRRYTIRLDGFVSVHAPLSGGMLLTKYFTFKGDSLELNFSTSAAGSIQIEIQDSKGEPIPGFTEANCKPIFGDSVGRNITWNNNAGSGLSALEGRIIRLRFILKDADIYSFRFH